MGEELLGGVGGGTVDLGEIEALIASKAPLVSPGFSGTPTAPTAADGTDTTQIATTAFVAAALTGFEGAVLPYGTSVMSTANDTVTNEEPIPFNTELIDSAGMWSIGDPTKVHIPRDDWYWVGADITTLGTAYGGPNNTNVSIAIMKNWDGVSTQLGYYVAYERFNNEDGASAAGNSLLQLVYLEAGDVLQVILIGNAGSLLVESNPSDGVPSGFPNDTGPGTLSPHFFVISARPGGGPKGDTGEPGADGEDGAPGLIQSVVEGPNVSIDNTDPANPVISATTDGPLAIVRAFRNAGNVSINWTAVTAIASGTTAGTGLDLVFPDADVNVGDRIIVGINGLLANVAQAVAIDVGTLVSGAIVNYFGSGLDASLATKSGVIGWFGPASAVDCPLSGLTRPYTVQAGDLDGSGNLTLRFMAVKSTTTPRTLYANGNAQLEVFAINLSQ